MFEYRVRYEYEEAPEGVYDTVPLGTEERAARVTWEKMRAEFVTRYSPLNYKTNESKRHAPTRLVFEARKVGEWAEQDDTTPEYERGVDAETA